MNNLPQSQNQYYNQTGSQGEITPKQYNTQNSLPGTNYQPQGTGLTKSQSPTHMSQQIQGQNVFNNQPIGQGGYIQDPQYQYNPNAQYGNVKYGNTQYSGYIQDPTQNMGGGQPISSYGQQQKEMYGKKSTNYFSTALTIDPSKYIFACNEEEVNEIFAAFQRGGVVVLTEFLDSLKTTGLASTCTIVAERIEDWIKANRTNEANEDTFKNFFKFDLSNENDFRYVYRVIDANKSGSIGKGEILDASKKYELNLTQDDARVMVDNLRTTNADSVTRDEIYRALYKKQVL